MIKNLESALTNLKERINSSIDLEPILENFKWCYIEPADFDEKPKGKRKKKLNVKIDKYDLSEGGYKCFYGVFENLVEEFGGKVSKSLKTEYNSKENCTVVSLLTWVSEKSEEMGIQEEKKKALLNQLFDEILYIGFIDAQFMAELYPYTTRELGKYIKPNCVQNYVSAISAWKRLTKEVTMSCLNSTYSFIVTPFAVDDPYLDAILIHFTMWLSKEKQLLDVSPIISKLEGLIHPKEPVPHLDEEKYMPFVGFLGEYQTAYERTIQ